MFPSAINCGASSLKVNRQYPQLNLLRHSNLPHIEQLMTADRWICISEPMPRRLSLTYPPCLYTRCILSGIEPRTGFREVAGVPGSNVYNIAKHATFAGTVNIRVWFSQIRGSIFITLTQHFRIYMMVWVRDPTRFQR